MIADQSTRTAETPASRVIARQQRHEPTWQDSYPRFDQVVAARGLRIGAEIGVAFGGHAEAMLRTTAVERLYGVDPYRARTDYIDGMNMPQTDFDTLYAATLARLSPFGERYQHVRAFSVEAARQFIPGQLDFVYIDADHSYQGVWDDLCAWFARVRLGGIIGGHDYAHPDLPEVQAAVDDFFRRIDWPVHDEGAGVWWVEKQAVSISYFMPAYNCAGTVRASVESIMRDNFQPGDELIIVNDGSTDSTADVLTALQRDYPAVRILSHRANRGGGPARNTAVDAARYPLLFCLDSDNLLLPNSVRPLAAFLIESGLDVAAFGVVRYFLNKPEQVTHEWQFKAGRVTLADCLSNYRVPPSSGNYLFTRESWTRAGGYPDSWMDTWGFGLRQIATGAKMAALPDTAYLHRYGHESYWVRGEKQGKVSLTALQILLPYLDRLDSRDVDYMLSRRGRNAWFDDLEQHPIRLATPAKPSTSLVARVRRRAARFLKGS